MASFLDLEDEQWELQEILDKRSSNIFQKKTNKPQLQVSRLFMTGIAQASEAMSVEQNVEVKDASQLKNLKAASNNLLQVFFVRQEGSWTSLDISRELFEDFVHVFAAFSPVWNCMFTFGKKSTEHECEFPGFKSRGPSTILGHSAIESAYVIRRAERNHRKLTEGQTPWSVRQSAVYHRYDPPADELLFSNSVSNLKFRSTLLLVSPSKLIERKIGRLLELALSDEGSVAPCIIHSLIVADSIRGWMDYISWLEKYVKDKSVQITFAELGSADDESLDGFSFNVEDRQGLKVTEDMVVDLQIILSTLCSTIRGIRKHCEKCCDLSCVHEEAVNCACGAALSEFDGYLTEVDLCIERARTLKERVVSTANLLSDLLRYEDQKALKELTEQSQEENQTMRTLAVLHSGAISIISADTQSGEEHKGR